MCNFGEEVILPFFLPAKHHFNHNYCFFLHDLMATIIKKGEANKHFWVKFTPKENEIKEFQNLQGNDLYDWMKSNGYQDEADLLSYKQVYVATLSDFLQFIFTALRSSEKGHLSVTYSLLRKPLKDNLFILESLLSEPNEFLNKFNSTTSYKEIAIDKQQPEKKKEIIKNVLEKIPFGLMDSDFLYNLRYSKNEDYSLERLWQKATHIVTSCQHYQTESGNLNFVFSDSQSKDDQWNYLYLILPFILFYAFQISITIYNGAITDEEIFPDDIWDRVLIGHILSNKNSVKESNLEDGNDHFKDIILQCQKCKNDVRLTREIQKQIQDKWFYKCKKGHKNDFFRLP